MSQLHQIAIAFDQFLNTLIPGGMADETLSARAHRMRMKNQRMWWWLADALDMLFFWQRGGEGHFNHCESSYLSEVNRSHLPDHYKRYLCEREK